MRVVVRKWGNSLALRLPRDLAKDLGLDEGSPVEMRSDGRQITIVRAAPRHTLADLVSRINDSNRHTEIATSPAGKEIW